jgi:Domain of unknown function (DUF5666)
MKRSLAIAAATAVCGGTVAIATAAYANSTDSPGSKARGTPPGWVGPLVESSTSGPFGSGSDCELHRTGPRNLPDIADLPEPPEPLYSEQAVRDPETGEVVHQASQTGRVEAVSDGTMTVESSDGTSWEWQLTDDTAVHRGFGDDASISSIEAGDRILVHGTVDGDRRQADHIAEPPPDLSDLGKRLEEELGNRLEKLADRLPGLRECVEERDEGGAGTAA